MSTVTLRIQVDKSGASENIGAVKRDLQGMGETGAQAGAQASGGVNGLSSAINGAKAAVGAFLAVYAGIQTLTGVVRLADEYQGMSDRLRLATSSTAEFTAAQAGVFAVAQQTGAALGAVNDLYVGLSGSTEQLGLNQGELLTITAAINQSFAISGTNAASAEAATRQLGQAFASGVLRGDEFNSMMENAPGLASALATSLGVTTGELRAMAAEGKLTSDVLAQGLLTQAPAIAEQFGQMGTTVGRAFTQLSNSVLKFVGEASQATGAASALAAVITGIANGLPALAFGLTAVAAGYGAITLASAGANAGLFTTAGLVGALATGLGALVVAYSAYKLGEYLVNEFTLVQAAVRSLYVGLNDAWTAIKVGALQAVAAVRVAFITAFDAITDRLADLIEAFVSFSQIELPLGLRADFAYGQAEAMTELARRVRDTTDAVVENDAVTGDLKAQMDAARAEAERYAASMFDAVDSLHEGKTATEGTTTATKALTPAVAAATKATKEATKAVDLHKQAVDAISGSTIAYTSGLGTAVSALANVTTATDTTRGAVGGLGDAIDQSVIDAENWARYWESAADAVLGAFGDLFSGGIDSLEDFGDEMIRITQRIVGDMIKEFARTGRIQFNGSDGTTAGNIGAGIQGLGFAYAGYQNARQGGNPLATVGSFTLAGAQIGSIVPIIGTAVGAIIGAVVGAAVAIFGGPGDPLLRVRSSEFSGPRRSEGQAQSALGNIFVRTENTPDGAGTSPEIAQRIADFDNLIAGFLSADQLSVVRTALANVNDTFENGAFTLENALNSRLGTILGVLGDDIDTFVGDAGTLEQRMGRLVDALVISSAAATGIVSSDFGEMATLLTRFRVGAEGLGDTFLRTVAGMSLVDDALLMLGGTFGGTRLQAATFAGELIELAGGLDQFSARLNGALEALFSEPERNQFLLDQARQSLNSALAGLNIGGVGIDNIREQLRTQLRDAMAAGNSALVNELLIAGNALGAFSTAVGRVGDSAEGLLSGPFGTSIGSSGGIGRPGQLVSPAGTAVQTQIQAVQSTNTILNGHTAILTRIALASERGTGTSPGTLGPGGSLGGGGSPKTGGDATAVLVQIKGLIEQAVRTQVTEALKRTTGANARAATA